ncbi:MAG: CsbD family protein [Alphaproteobacteria bacterium]
MNKHHVEGAARQAKGAVKDVVGDATGNPKLQAEGKAEKLAGKAHSTLGDIKDKAHELGDEAERKSKNAA